MTFTREQFGEGAAAPGGATFADKPVVVDLELLLEPATASLRWM